MVEAETLTVGEAARLLRVTARTVDRWASRGAIPFVMNDAGRRRYPRAEIEALAASLAEE